MLGTQHHLEIKYTLQKSILKSGSYLPKSTVSYAHTYSYTKNVRADICYTLFDVKLSRYVNAKVQLSMMLISIPNAKENNLKLRFDLSFMPVTLNRLMRIRFGYMLFSRIFF